MTLEQAVAVLNEREHNELDDWCVEIITKWARGATSGGEYLREFEAIAVAEKYLRDEPRTATTGDAT